MGNPFSKDFWLGEQSNYQGREYQFDPAAFGSGAAGAETQSALMARMRGEAPSVAELQMQQGIGRALQGSQAMQASAVGMSPGLAQRLAGQRSAQIMGEGNLAMGQLRAQEQMAAEQRLMEWLERERQAQMALQMARANEFGRVDQMGWQQALANRRQGVGGMLLSGAAQGLGTALSSRSTPPPSKGM